MADLAVDNVPTRLCDFEPVHIPNSLARVRNCRTDSVFDACFRGTDNFKNLIYVIGHLSLATVPVDNRCWDPPQVTRDGSLPPLF
jgi:hypothetical protein